MENPQPNPTDTIAHPPNPIKRAGCGFLLIGWFLLLLLPCFLFSLAARGTLGIGHPGLPEPENHPLVQVQLISEIDYRGLALTRSYLSSQTDSNLCIETAVSYLLWEGEGDNALYCECYFLTDSGDWQYNEFLDQPCTK
ncbi:hypothetical protein MASR2M15_20100 [Anaerolineales bacterium]